MAKPYEQDGKDACNYKTKGLHFFKTCYKDMRNIFIMCIYGDIFCINRFLTNHHCQRHIRFSLRHAFRKNFFALMFAAVLILQGKDRPPPADGK
jgi:hypothetical protein